ncbi:hypothetical protein [Phytoactinopolyspora mesophila]|uniref:hypothetical protein n=1 Tax=Phytoactinopolyspora mesophila TaxID=2650750 RepID=UPI001FE49F46|nr:hypothetical protein [Phytoactinopolyspora mesophila]
MSAVSAGVDVCCRLFSAESDGQQEKYANPLRAWDGQSMNPRPGSASPNGVIPKVTSCAFAGAQLDHRVITTAGGSETQATASAGDLFVIRPGVTELPGIHAREDPDASAWPARGSSRTDRMSRIGSVQLFHGGGVRREWGRATY